MSETTIRFNGVPSIRFHAHVYRINTDDAPARMYNAYGIDGRNGNLLTDRKRYPNVTVRYTVIIEENAEKNFSDMKNYLLSQVGYKRLEDDEHPDEFYLAYVSGPIEPEVSTDRSIFRFELTFSRKPQRFLTSGETVYSWVEGATNTPVEGNNLRLYGYQLDRSVFTARWDLSQLGSGDPSPDNVRRFSLPFPQVDIRIDGQTEYSELLYEEGVAAAVIDLVAGTCSITHRIVDLPSSGWTKVGDGVFQHAGNGVTYNSLCSHYKPYSISSPDMSIDTSDNLIVVRDPRFPSVGRFEIWLTNAAVSVAYELTTPTIRAVDPFGELPGEWFDISSIWTLRLAIAPEPVMTNPTVFPSQPIIRARGTGSFSINDVVVTISEADEYTDIDCELMDCYKGDENKNRYVSFSTYDFPVLYPGTNPVVRGEGITVVSIRPRWWRL